MRVPATLQHADIAWRIPHQGRMCLLERVGGWDMQKIRCEAGSHRDSNNPLRAHGRLGASCGIEYAAQAMGYLVSVRGVALHGDFKSATNLWHRSVRG